MLIANSGPQLKRGCHSEVVPFSGHLWEVDDYQKSTPLGGGWWPLVPTSGGMLMALSAHLWWYVDGFKCPPLGGC